MSFTLKRHKTISSSSIAIATIAHLPDDTVAEIISRLPIRHMICCMPVSKLWYNLITTICIPRITSSPLYGFFFNTLSPYSTYNQQSWTFAPSSAPNTSIIESVRGNTLPFNPSRHNFLDCSNGLLLFFCCMSMNFYVCNPSTQQYFVIPNSPHLNSPGSGALIFCPHYRVVYITGPPTQMGIFCPKTCRWSVYNLNLDPYIANSICSARYIFLDGFLYRTYSSGYLLKIDVTEISSQTIELPNIVVRGSTTGCLGVSKGILHYSWRDKKSLTVRVWMLTLCGDTDEWLLKYTIGLQCCDEHLWSAVFAFHPTSDMLFVGNSREVLSYNPDTKSLVTVCKLSEDKIIDGGQDFVLPYSVNLTPLVAFGKSMIKKPPGIENPPARVLNF